VNVGSRELKSWHKPKDLKKAMSVSAGLQHIAALAIAPRARIIMHIPNKLIAKKARRKGMKSYKLSRSNAGFYPADLLEMATQTMAMRFSFLIVFLLMLVPLGVVLGDNASVFSPFL
jgi:hypothetical protein